MSALVLRSAVVDDAPVDVRIEDGHVTAVQSPGSLRGDGEEIDCAGGALLPGLHDHHLHLLSMAATLRSVDVANDLDRALRDAHVHAPPGTWIRAVNYDEVESGPLDRWRLDSLAPGRPVRVQHRSGAMWVLSSVALEQVGALACGAPEIERDHADRPTGRLYRVDEWLRSKIPQDGGMDLDAVGRRLAGFGVTGVTDCTPVSNSDYFDTLAAAVNGGALPLTVSTTGGPELSETDPPFPLRRGPVKILLSDHAFPHLEDLEVWIDGAHRIGRTVAVHCVSRSALIFALTAWRAAGSRPGDRIEHASVTPPEVVPTLVELGLTVVTQPSFMLARGDRYLSEVEAVDRADLYRCGSLLAAGVGVAASTDAPFGPDDPWIAVRAAIERRTQSGARVGLDKGLAPASALRLFLAPLENPAGPIRRVTPGVAADLCLLDVPLRTALLDPSSRHVAATIAGGKCTYAS